MPSRRMPFAVFALVGAVALGGCTGEAAPEPSPSGSSASSTASGSPSASVTPSPSVSESGPAIPAAAREQTEAGAEAFVRFYFDQVNVAWTEPRAGLIQSLSDPKCEFCKGIEETAKFLVTEKERYASAAVEVIKVEAFVGAPENQQYLAVEMEQKAARIVDEGGAIVSTEKRLVDESYVALVWSDTRWALLEVERTK